MPKPRLSLNTIKRFLIGPLQFILMSAGNSKTGSVT